MRGTTLYIIGGVLQVAGLVLGTDPKVNGLVLIVLGGAMALCW